MRSACRSTRNPAHVLLALVALLLVSAPITRAQQRLSDRDVQNLIGNLHDDAKNFVNPYKDALKKSSVRKSAPQNRTWPSPFGWSNRPST